MIDPLHQFKITPIYDIKFGGLNLSFTNSSFAVCFAVLVLIVLMRIGLSKRNMVPNRMQAAIEIAYNFISSLIQDNIGADGIRYFSFVFSLFFLILFGNLTGLIPGFFTFTSHIIVTFTLASIVFSVIILSGIYLHGFGFLKLFAPSGVPLFLMPLFIPIEFFSFLSKPVSLSIRLFANMMAGHTVMKVIAGFCVMLGFFGVIPLAISVALTGLEFMIACLQAYIFTVLTCIYINDVVHLH